MAVYYRLDDNNIYYTNEAKEGYTLRPEYSQDSRGKFIVVELYNNEFILPENSAYLFYRATNTSFNDMNKWDTSEVTNMDHMFSDCWYLQSLDFSNFDTSKVTTMSIMFSSCIALTSLDLSSWDTPQCTNMNGMFTGCTALQSLDITNFNTSNVTDIAGMFERCRSLSSLNIASFDTSKVIEMSNLFRYCEGIVTIYASTDFVLTSVRNSSMMFTDCTNLVGGAGTTYNSSKVDKTYARIDEGRSKPGYFTLGANPHGWFKCTPYLKENGIWVPVDIYY